MSLRVGMEEAVSEYASAHRRTIWSRIRRQEDSCAEPGRTKAAPRQGMRFEMTLRVESRDEGGSPC